MKKIIAPKEAANFRPFGGSGANERRFDSATALVYEGSAEYTVEVAWCYPDSRPETTRLAEAKAAGLSETPVQKAYLCAIFSNSIDTFTVSIEFGLMKWRRATNGQRVNVAVGTFMDKVRECAAKARGASYEEALKAFECLKGMKVTATEDVSSVATFKRFDGGEYDACSVVLDVVADTTSTKTRRK